MPSVSVSAFGSFTKWAEQSKLVNSHLCGLKTKLSACVRAAHQVAELGADHRASGPGRVDVQVEAMPANDLGDRRDVVAGADAGAADAGDDGGGKETGRAIAHRSRRRAHPDPSRTGRRAPGCARGCRIADPGDAHRFVDRGMHMRRGIDADRRVGRKPVAVAGEAEHALAGGEDRGERRSRGRNPG